MPYATRVTYVASSGQRDYDVTFPYLDAAHVAVTVSGNLQPASAYQWIGNNRIRLAAAPAGGSVVRLARRTPLDHALVQFRNGAVLAEDELNRAVLQILYVQQELADLYNESLDKAQVRLGDNLGVVTTPDQIMDDLAAIVLADELLVDLVNRIQGNEALAQQVIEEALRGVELKRGVNVIDGRVKTVETSTSQLAAILSLLAILDPSGESLVLREDKVFRGNGESYAQAFTRIETNFGDVGASITELGQALINSDGAFATLKTTLGAYATDGSGAFVLNEANVRRTNGDTFAETFNGLTARMAGAEAGVISANNAVATEASARATAINGVISRLGPVEASVTTLSQADTALGAKWGVALNVNGYISGIITNNNGTSSDFNIVADKFRIVSPGGGTPITVFQTDGAYASFANPVTVTAGSYKLVMGPAFGVSNNLILWYGSASIAVTSCSTANAIFALTINGTTVIPAGPGANPLKARGNVTGVEAMATTWPSTIMTPSASVTASGGAGGYSYAWVVSSRFIEIIAPGNSSTTFRATLNGSTSAYEGIAICTVTDANGDKTQVVFTVLFTTNA